MKFDFFMEALNGINLGVELCSASMMLLLLVALCIKNVDEKEMYYYRFFVAANTLAMCCEGISYVLAGNASFLVVIHIVTILTYVATAFSAFGFYAYLHQHYLERYRVQFCEKSVAFLFSYVVLLSIIYISSAWTGWFYVINEAFLYEPGPYAPLSGIMFVPLLLVCLYVSIQNRKVASKRETVIHSLFSIIYIAFAYLDARFMTAMHFLSAVVFAFLIYIMISVEQEQELEKKEVELVKSELNALRLQMNPHFIYNTLASIDGLCTYDPEEARSLIAKFTRHLRGSYLDNSPTTIPFEKELDNLRSYFEVEKVRFPDITFVTDIRTSDFEVPPLTIQPIFENAIKHGICGKDEPEGTITLATYEQDGCYHVVISDDGAGFDVNQKKQPDGRAHLGVANTQKRLELICNGQMVTTSNIGEGTVVDMIIPKKEY